MPSRVGMVIHQYILLCMLLISSQVPHCELLHELIYIVQYLHDQIS